ncbi:hypothetical protein [Burkholderia sp. Ac-20365]|uniref:hypothetical protein n=1 Tax=Burkholderia sp. Ac-20365 TaxID=2703897 RepID=UPI00197C8D30|nr:hypothetical protein [Burkholderia sp. Ac-20365]MBN3761261.1 hypothetical protein [Burkholderia sp. Ac-20365]
MNDAVQTNAFAAKVLRVVRALALTGEAASKYLLVELEAGRPLSPLDVKLSVVCADRAEHAAQYALDGVSEGSQARCLLGDIEFLLAVDRDKLHESTRSAVPRDTELHELRHAFMLHAREHAASTPGV